MVDKPRIEPALVQDFVNHAHSDFARVRDLLEREPALINAAWDWGAGDWGRRAWVPPRIWAVGTSRCIFSSGARA